MMEPVQRIPRTDRKRPFLPGMRSCRKRLASKLLVLVAPVFLIGGIAFLSYNRLWETREHQHEEVDKARELSRLVFKSLYSAMLKGGNRKTGREIVRSLKGVGDFTRIWIVDGEPVTRQFGRDAEDQPRDRLDLQALAGNPSTDVRWQNGHRLVRFSKPVRARDRCLSCHQVRPGEVLGVVSTEISPRMHEQSELRHEILFIAGLGSVLLMMGALVFIAVRNTMLRPLQEIGRGVAAFANGDMGYRIQVRTGDELETLAGEFNRMAQLVQEARTEEQAALLNLSQNLLGLLDPEAIARTAFQIVRERLKPDALSLFSVIPEGTHLELVAGEGWSHDRVGRAQVPLHPPERNGIAWAVHTRKPYYRDLRLEDPSVGVPAVLKEAGVKSSLIVPMIACEVNEVASETSPCTGVFALNSLTPRTFTEEEVRFVSLVANQVALALQRAREYLDLTEAEARFRTLFEGVPVGVYRTTASGRILDANPAMVEILGYPDKETLLNANASALYLDPEDRHQWMEVMQQNTAAQDFETQMVRYDGTAIWVRDKARAVRDASGHVLYYEGALRDVTEQKQAEEEYRTILSTAMDSFWIADIDSHYLYVNDAYCQLIGYSREELLTMSIRDLEAVETPEDVIEHTRRVRETGHDRFGTRHRCKNGKTLDLEISVNYVESNGGRFFGFGRDITDRKQAEERLARLNEAFLSFGADPVENINRLVALCGEQMGATCALYNRLEDGVLRSLGMWHAPPDYDPVDKAEGHVCNDVIKDGSSEVCVITDLAQTAYAQTDPNVARYGLKTYIGKAVSFGGVHIGSLCVVYQEDYAPSEEDKRLLEIVASAIGVEEERRQAEKQLLEESSINAALLELETALGKAQSEKAVCDTAVDVVSLLIRGADGYIWLWDAERKRLRPFVAPSHLSQDLREKFFSPERTFESRPAIAEVLQTHQPMIVEDSFKSPLLHETAIREFNVRSFVLTPLMAGNEVLGLMGISRPETGAFSEREIVLAQGAAQRIGMALEGERSRADVHQQLSRVSLINQITRSIGERQDLRSIFRVVLALLEDHLPIDLGGILLFDEPTNTLTVAARGPKSEKFTEGLSLAEGTRINLREIGLRACLRGKTVYGPDLTRATAPILKKYAGAGMRSGVAVPLIVDNRVIGILTAARREVDGFSSAECEFLRTLGEHVALAAHHAQLYEDLQKAYDDLTQTQQAIMQQERLRALGEMASGIAHDINNALSPVLGYSELLLLRGELDEKSRGFVEAISTSAKDIAAVVARLREFYRKRDTREDLLPVDVTRLITLAVSLTQPRWRDMPLERGLVIDVQTELPEDLPSIAGNEAELREALTNLIINAVDAMPQGGTITLRAYGSPEGSGSPLRSDMGVWEYGGEREGTTPTHPDTQTPTHVIIEVSDTGVGMTEEVRRRCLEPFYSTKGERGTGMGLSMVYGIVSRHNGEISIQSAPGEGTTFVVRLPISREQTSATETRPAVVKPARILCVDDDPRVRAFLKEALTAMGHTVEVADGGQAGINAFEATPFEVVITDLGMPEVDGRAVTAAIKALSPQTPVILLTGWGNRMHAEGDIPQGVAAVLSKPVTPQQLQEALAKVMGE